MDNNKLPPILPITLLLCLGIVAGRVWLPLVGMHSPIVCAIATFVVMAAGLLTMRNTLMVNIIAPMTAFCLGCMLITLADNTTTVIADMMPTEPLTPLRQQLSRVFALYSMDSDINSIVAAMTLGERGGISSELKEAYYASGVGHIFALSGMHLGIIYGIISMILPTRRWRKLSAVVLLISMWAFVMLVGAHASVMRAAVMLSIYTLCQMADRTEHNVVSVLCFTIIVLLTLRAQWLFDVGFQMSCMAMAGILTLMTPLTRLYPKRLLPHYEMPLWKRLPLKGLYAVWGLIALSLAAQTGVIPLTLHYFGRLSTYFIASNLIVSPLCIAIIALAIALLAVHSISMWTAFLSPMASWIATALQYCVGIQNDAMKWVSLLPYSHIDNLKINTAQTVVLYVMIIAIIALIKHLHRNITLFKEGV
jgi:competence protein ComEC